MLRPEVSHKVVPPRPELVPARAAVGLAPVALSRDCLVLASMVPLEVLPGGEA